MKSVKAFVPIVFLVGLLILNVLIFGDMATSGPNQLALLMTAITTSAIALLDRSLTYKELESAILKTLAHAMQPCMILILVGALIAAWIYAGVVPSMIYYGIKIIHPSFFLPLTCVACSICSIASGSSWSTGGTLGVALMGIGAAMGHDPAVVAGAVISGSYFGDKLSPLSDTTNLAAAIAEVELFDHIKNLVYTTGPALILTLLGFTVLGFTKTTHHYDSDAIAFVDVIQQNFAVHPLLLLIPLIVLGLVIKKVPAVPALLVGVILGVIGVFVFQGALVERVVKNGSSYAVMIDVLYRGFKFDLQSTQLNALLNQGGIESMYNTVFLICSAMVFGGSMDVAGHLRTLAGIILKLFKGATGLIWSTVNSAFIFNIITSDQYLSIVVTGEMYKEAYKERNVPSKYLSRCLEDGGTATSVLVPWNTCGAYFSTILGVSTLAYLPYCFFNLLSPLMSVIITPAVLKKNTEQA